MRVYSSNPNHFQNVCVSMILFISIHLTLVSSSVIIQPFASSLTPQMNGFNVLQNTTNTPVYHNEALNDIHRNVPEGFYNDKHKIKMNIKNDIKNHLTSFKNSNNQKLFQKGYDQNARVIDDRIRNEKRRFRHYQYRDTDNICNALETFAINTDDIAKRLLPVVQDKNEINPDNKHSILNDLRSDVSKMYDAIAYKVDCKEWISCGYMEPTVHNLRTILFRIHNNIQAYESAGFSQNDPIIINAKLIRKRAATFLITIPQLSSKCKLDPDSLHLEQEMDQDYEFKVSCGTDNKGFSEQLSQKCHLLNTIRTLSRDISKNHLTDLSFFMLDEAKQTEKAADLIALSDQMRKITEELRQDLIKKDYCPIMDQMHGIDLLVFELTKVYYRINGREIYLRSFRSSAPAQKQISESILEILDTSSNILDIILSEIKMCDLEKRNDVLKNNNISNDLSGSKQDENSRKHDDNIVKVIFGN